MENNPKSLKSRILEGIGTLAILVGLVLGLIQLYDYFSSKVEATATITEYHTPPPILDGYVRSEIYKEEIAEKSLDSLPVNSILIDSIIKNESFRTRSAKANIHLQSADDFGTYTVFKIQNLGNEPLEDIILELNYLGYYQILYHDDKTKDSVFIKKIKIGKLNPTHIVTVRCWGNSDYNSNSIAFENKAKISYDKGAVEVEFVNQPSQFVSLLSGLPWFLYVIIAVFVLMLITEMKSSNKKKELIDSAEQEKNDSLGSDGNRN